MALARPSLLNFNNAFALASSCETVDVTAPTARLYATSDPTPPKLQLSFLNEPFIGLLL